ncbi:MAG: FAD-dependent oxidoreductase [Clostridia bacterium]|nr:FAD-dependent oxidoreductase [Clostridia bacterium]
MLYDIVVIGAGPAGLTAALYAGRAEKSVLVIEKESFGGQITHSPRVENYPGFEVISGNELADRLIEQVFAQGAEIELDEVTSIEGKLGEYKVVCKGGEYDARTVIIATGSHHRTLGIEGEDALVGNGISYCAVCDGAFYKGKTVAVIGGGNSALVDAVMLSESCAKVYIVQNLPYLTGEKRLATLLESRENVEIILSTTVKSFVEKDGELSGIVLSSESGEHTLSVDGIFVAIGQKPENEPFASVTSLNEYGYIVSDESCVPEGASEGIFVAGDCRTKSVRQVATACADGAVAALAACRLIDGNK